jgi:hypothetical protein
VLLRFLMLTFGMFRELWAVVFGEVWIVWCYLVQVHLWVALKRAGSVLSTVVSNECEEQVRVGMVRTDLGILFLSGSRVLDSCL